MRVGVIHTVLGPDHANGSHHEHQHTHAAAGTTILACAVAIHLGL